MNMTMVDVTNIAGVSLEDPVVLLGHQGDDEVTAEQLAGWCGSINYEIVSRISGSIPRTRIRSDHRPVEEGSVYRPPK